MQDNNKNPITLNDVVDTVENRVSKITEEFRGGFNFLKCNEKSVTFWGSARTNENNDYYKSARSLGGKVAKDLGYSVVTGGGPGIMEAANRGAFENGGISLGLTIELPGGQCTNKYLTAHYDYYYFFIRKVSLSFSAEAYIFFPGGYGTLDEFFEILTLVQTGKIRRIPIILFGSKFWNKLDSFIKDSVLSMENIDSFDTTLYTITDDESEAIEIIRKAPVRNELVC